MLKEAGAIILVKGNIPQVSYKDIIFNIDTFVIQFIKYYMGVS